MIQASLTFLLPSCSSVNEHFERAAPKSSSRWSESMAEARSRSRICSRFSLPFSDGRKSPIQVGPHCIVMHLTEDCVVAQDLDRQLKVWGLRNDVDECLGKATVSWTMPEQGCLMAVSAENANVDGVAANISSRLAVGGQRPAVDPYCVRYGFRSSTLTHGDVLGPGLQCVQVVRPPLHHLSPLG